MKEQSLKNVSLKMWRAGCENHGEQAEEAMEIWMEKRLLSEKQCSLARVCIPSLMIGGGVDIDH